MRIVGCFVDESFSTRDPKEWDTEICRIFLRQIYDYMVIESHEEGNKNY